jgi:soluble lytic murein transglycosylase
MLSAEERLCIAHLVSEAGDWPSTIAIAPNFGEIRDVSRWIGVAYPAAYTSLIAEQSDRYGVPRELLYAVARKESWFSRAAVSSAGALGLFQFLPTTFEELNERWQLLDGQSGSTATTEGYLTDALLSIDLGARWFRHLIQAQSGSIVRALMEHNAGSTAVSNWTNAWELAGRDDDIEYMVETARYGQTRIFTRRVLELMAVVHGTGRLDH